MPNLTFGPDVIAAQRKTTKLMFETQLMVSERCAPPRDAPVPRGDEGSQRRAGVVIIVEACAIHRSLSNIRAMGGSPSVALNPSTPARASNIATSSTTSWS